MEKDNKNRTKFWKGVLVGALITAFAGLIIVGVATGISLIGRTVIDNRQEYMVESSGGKAPARQELDMERINTKLETFQEIINRYYLFDEDMEKVENGIYKGMLAGLEDPYTVYYTPEEYQSLTEETEGVYCGIGVLVTQNMDTGIITALRVFKGSPAEEAGMKKGDIFYKVGELEASAEELDVLVQNHIRGEEGTTVDITVLRDGEEIPMTIERRIVETTTVEGQMLDDQTGYILVTQFELVTGDQFRKTVEELETQGMKRLVIDLRDNPGGVLDSCVDIAAYILPDDQYNGTIISTSDKYGSGVRYYSEGGEIRYEENGETGKDPRYPKKDEHEMDMPIAVLINENSASAAEVLAGALKDYGAATLVGTTSFGKGIVQSLLPLNDGSAVKVTIAHYYTPSGFDLHKKGLDPDVDVEMERAESDAVSYGKYDDVSVETDNQLKAAIEALE
ncbi:MAG: S41 family peptidase [Brotaphodocola sp.]